MDEDGRKEADGIWLPDDLEVPDWEEGEDSRVIARTNFYIVTGNNITELLQWRDGHLSVHTRLPDLDGFGIHDRYYEHPETAYDAASEEYSRRCDVIGQLGVVKEASPHPSRRVFVNLPVEEEDNEPDRQFYVLMVWNDVEPELIGPYDSMEERDLKARDMKDGDNRHGVYGLDVARGGDPRVASYSGQFFEEDEECG